MTDPINRREFSQLFAAIFCFLWGAKAQAETNNKSYWQHRISDDMPDNFSLCEKALALEWEEWNKTTRGGNGILQDLMISTYRVENPKEFDPFLSERERRIVATVIQWLGTNVGRSFLHEASRRMGAAEYPFSKALDSYWKNHKHSLDT